MTLYRRQGMIIMFCAFRKKGMIINMNEIRMCVVCRERRKKNEFIRVVHNKNEEFLIDKTGKAGGRGAYVCNNRDCLNILQKKRNFNKAFRCNVPNDLYEELGNC